MARSHYKEQMEKKRSDLLGKLLCSDERLNLVRDSKSFENALEFSVKSLQKYQFLDNSVSDVRKSYTGISERISFDGDDVKSHRLMCLAEKIMSKKPEIPKFEKKTSQIIGENSDIFQTSNLKHPEKILSLLSHLFNAVPDSYPPRPHMPLDPSKSDFNYGSDLKKCGSTHLSSKTTLESVDCSDSWEEEFRNAPDSDFDSDFNINDEIIHYGSEEDLKYQSNIATLGQRNDLAAGEKTELDQKNHFNDSQSSTEEKYSDSEYHCKKRAKYCHGQSCIDFVRSEKIIDFFDPTVKAGSKKRYSHSYIQISRPHQLYSVIQRSLKNIQASSDDENRVQKRAIIPEAEIVMASLQMMRGVSSDIFSCLTHQKDSSTHSSFFTLSDEAKYINVLHLSPHTLHSVISHFIDVANIALYLRSLVQSVQNETLKIVSGEEVFQYGSSISFFIEQVGIYLQEFEKRMSLFEDTLYRARRGEKCEHFSTLIALREKVQHDSNRLKLLDNICQNVLSNYSTSKSGNRSLRLETALLLNTLFFSTQKAFLVENHSSHIEDSTFQSESDWILYIFMGTLKVYLRIIDSWISNGNLDDPFEETFLVRTLSTKRRGNKAIPVTQIIVVDQKATPRFLKGVSKSICFAGEDFQLAHTLKYEHKCDRKSSSNGWYHIVNKGVSEALKYYFLQDENNKNNCSDLISRKRKFSAEKELVERFMKLRKIADGLQHSSNVNYSNPKYSLRKSTEKDSKYHSVTTEDIIEFLPETLSSSKGPSIIPQISEVNKMSLYQKDNKISFPPLNMRKDEVYEKERKELIDQYQITFQCQPKIKKVIKDDIFVPIPGQNSILPLFEIKEKHKDEENNFRANFPPLNYPKENKDTNKDLFQNFLFTEGSSESPKAPTCSVANGISDPYVAQKKLLEEQRRASGLYVVQVPSINDSENKSISFPDCEDTRFDTSVQPNNKILQPEKMSPRYSIKRNANVKRNCSVSLLYDSQWNDDWNRTSEDSSDTSDSENQSKNGTVCRPMSSKSAEHESSSKREVFVASANVPVKNRRKDGFFSGTGQIAYDPAMVNRRPRHPFFRVQKHPMEKIMASEESFQKIETSSSTNADEQNALINACTNVRCEVLPPSMILEQSLLQPLHDHFKSIGRSSVKHLLGDMGLLPLISTLWTLNIGKTSYVMDRFHSNLFTALQCDSMYGSPHSYLSSSYLSEQFYESIMSSNPTNVNGAEKNVINIMSQPLPAAREPMYSHFHFEIDSQSESENMSRSILEELPIPVDRITLRCFFPSPYSEVLDESILADYEKIRKLFARVSYVLHVVNEAHLNALRVSREKDRTSEIYDTFRSSRCTLFQMLFFLRSLYSYLSNMVDPRYWDNFVTEAKEAASVRDLRRIHRDHVNAALRRFFLDPKQKKLLDKVNRVLVWCVQFTAILNEYDGAINRNAKRFGPPSIVSSVQRFNCSFFADVSALIRLLGSFSEEDPTSTVELLTQMLNFNERFIIKKPKNMFKFLGAAVG